MRPGVFLHVVLLYVFVCAFQAAAIFYLLIAHSFFLTLPHYNPDMSSTLPRIAARQANKFQKPNNPFMSSTQTTEQPAFEPDRVNPLIEPSLPEAAPVPEKESDFSIRNFFRMSWAQRLSPDSESLDQSLIRNVKRLIEEERDRQMAFERMCQTQLNY
ncbi:hypothetical protein OESDEN_01347 [Oesophagostomum dentatum]|uniref:Uncharacterized protein n=1 Tax=Oesophagostomum dentatum TaxID=61180 RepID=A0A0B1TTD9_OESDE|nr:hypothetical protein OESDEN_01347 [Oesophagostomum dentatum]